ncbi:MAG: TolC family protein [Magnetococcus sp. YQC-5]
MSIFPPFLYFFATNLLAKGRILPAFLVILSVSGCSVITPVMTPAEQERLARQDQERMFKNQQALTGPLTLHDAMARAIKYNLDFRLKRMEEALSSTQEEVSQLEMLPKLTAAAGYSARSPVNASVSQSMNTGMVSVEPSVSSEATTSTTDFTVSWNLLDFGVSYFQAKQEGNKRLVQTEYRRKAAHNLLKDVRFAFWKAASAQWLEREIGTILQASEGAIESARKVEKEGLRSPVYALQFQLGLLEIVRQLEKSRADLAISKEELATLINLEPGTPYQLVDDSGVMDVAPELSVSIEELERTALSYRPELSIEHYQARIEADETRKAIARLFPGLEFNVAKNYDSNAFLVYQHWAQAGARLSWNLLRTLTGKQQLNLAESRENVIQMRRLVLQMAVLSQTRIAFHEYRSARASLQRFLTESATRRRLQDHTANRSSMGLDSQLGFVHTVAAAALGRIQQYEAFARYQSALGRLYASLGLDPLGDAVLDRELPRLARDLRENDQQWQKKFFATDNTFPFSNAKVMAPLPWSDLLTKKGALPSEGGLPHPVPAKASLPVEIRKNVAAEPPTKSALVLPNNTLPVQQNPVAPVSQKKAESSPTDPVAPVPHKKAESSPTDPIAPASPVKAEPTTKTRSKPRYVVQVAATMDQTRVEGLVAKLKSKGYHPHVNKTKGSDGRMVTQIWLGRYDKSEDALAARNGFQKKERQPVFIKMIDQ